VAASPIVTGKEAEENIPEPIRHAISFESGANDGLGYLFVFLPVNQHRVQPLRPSAVTHMMLLANS
ncbi:hypothetical protein ACETIH_04990, partial [Microvirga arabica]